MKRYANPEGARQFKAKASSALSRSPRFQESVDTIAVADTFLYAGLGQRVPAIICLVASLSVGGLHPRSSDSPKGVFVPA